MQHYACEDRVEFKHGILLLLKELLGQAVLPTSAENLPRASKEDALEASTHGSKNQYPHIVECPVANKADVEIWWQIQLPLRHGLLKLVTVKLRRRYAQSPEPVNKSRT